MEQNILLHRKRDELILEKREAIDILKELISEPVVDTTPEELKQFQDYIEKYEDEIAELDDDRYYLVDKDDNKKVQTETVA